MSDRIKLDQLDKFSVGNIVWAKLGSYRWWPAIIIQASDCDKPEAKFGNLWIFWFGDYKISELSKKRIIEFMPNFLRMYDESYKKKNFKKGVYEALETLATRWNYCSESSEALIVWAKNGFIANDRPLVSKYDIPILVLEHLERIKGLHRSETSNFNNAKEEAKAKEKEFKAKILLKKVRDNLLKIEDICIACRESKVEIVDHHPVFEGGLCFECKERTEENVCAFTYDGKSMCCIICSNPGSLIVCDKNICFRSYCCDCITLLLSPADKEEILETDPWNCFFCACNKNNYGLLRIRKDWKKSMMHFFKLIENEEECPLLDSANKRPLRVLSLFDGIGTGKQVLNNLGIEVEVYFASEIDEDAMNIAKMNHGNSIKYVGDVTLLTEEKIKSMSPIDLIIGGSPCNDLSLVNPNRKGLYDFNGTGFLVIHFFKVWKAVKELNKEVLFLFENVAAMSRKDKKQISLLLERNPVLIDAKYVSPQIRARYFWGNIPGLHTCQQFFLSSNGDESCDLGYEQEKLLSHFLLKNLNRKAMVEKIRTVTTQKNSLIQDNYNLLPVEMNGIMDILWVTELETIFGLPMHYTDTGNLNINKRRELLGRGLKESQDSACMKLAPQRYFSL
ncbi:hypothetical protein CDAR_591681 [Caerostris darwini]|uniref:DNA (cytosine-5-)-methyltransferase n=1 Tax=Caerostris darwini TaxID=1538125 RepID=A0AAV4PKB4_9ARAC|nr:hypothetical protein CDAR_591681 [Caerostris darwini]